jgi:hypothetical protein
MTVSLKRNEIVDLLGNSVPVNIVECVAERLIGLILEPDKHKKFVDTSVKLDQGVLF